MFSHLGAKRFDVVAIVVNPLHPQVAKFHEVAQIELFRHVMAQMNQLIEDAVKLLDILAKPVPAKFRCVQTYPALGMLRKFMQL